ncbi:MAG: FAD-dependent thymidylate synthase [Chloroflexia bacterium]|nr:FAD-dependent thymidylate synthase [Chloroflexia bacterium]
MKAIYNPKLSVGTELEIVNAARKSFDVEHETFTDGDANLIRFLIREGHWLPFRHPQLSFICEAPVFVARQLVKHQVGMSWSETSRRYKTEGVSFWSDPVWRHRPEGSIKQGRGEPFQSGAQVMMTARYQEHCQEALTLYQDLLALDVSPEQARAVLPQAMMVGWVWTGSLLAWLHLIKERTHPNVQAETEQFALMIAEEIRVRFPLTYEEVKNHEHR